MKLLKIIGSLLVLSLSGFFLIASSQSEAEKEYKITGLVQDATGKPMPSTRIELSKHEPFAKRTREVHTGENGRFDTRVVGTGTYLLILPNNGDQYALFGSIAGENGGYATVVVNDENPSPDVVVQALPPTPAISGKVLDKITKKRAEGADVKICLVSDPERCSGAIVERDGSFTIAVPIDEPFTFTIESSNHKTFQLKQENVHGVNDEVLIMKSGEKRNVTVALEEN